MQTKKNDLLNEVAEYYSDKLALHGETAKGVDWNGEEGQVLRFEQLCKLIPSDGAFTINDLGCGFGSLYDFLSERYDSFFYTGIDVAQDMISAAQLRYEKTSNAHFLVSNEPCQIADYSVASGIFNVRLRRSDEEWKVYIENTLSVLNRSSLMGFAFNCLTSYSDAEKMRDYLYYANPCVIFDICKRHYSNNVALLHDYNLYEFTVLVRKTI